MHTLPASFTPASARARLPRSNVAGTPILAASGPSRSSFTVASSDDTSSAKNPSNPLQHRSSVVTLVNGVPTVPTHPSDCYASVAVRALNYLRTHRSPTSAPAPSPTATSPMNGLSQGEGEEASGADASGLYADVDLAMGVDSRGGVSMEELLNQLDPSTTVPIAHFLKNLSTRLVVVPGSAFKESELDGYL